MIGADTHPAYMRLQALRSDISIAYVVVRERRKSLDKRARVDVQFR